MTKQKILIAVATAWGPKYGGINAFNYDLLIAVAAAHWSWLRVICVVAECTDDEIQLIQDQYQIELISIGLTGGSIGKEHATLVQSKLQEKGLCKTSDETVFLGHDRITGAVAIELAKAHGGRSALIHHMSYAHYESFAEDSATSQKKESEQRQLFRESNICLAVGPILQSSAASMLDREIAEIPMLVPGLAEISPRKHHNTFVAFVSGRLDAGAKKIKQAHLGVAGFAHAVYKCDSNSGLPNALRGENEPRLILRGIELEENPNPNSTGAEAELKELAQQHADRVISLQALPFTQDRTELFDELKTASVCLMPSWHEGFGLVAWEAIAAGVPLILSKKSGAYQLLKTLRKENLVHGIDVRGNTASPFFADADKEVVANLLIEIAKDHSSKRSDAHHLREELQTNYHWRACADAFVTALDWHTPTVSTPSLPLSVSPAPSTPAIATDLSQWVALPTQLWEQHSGLSPSQLLKAEEEFIPFAPERLQFLQTQLDWATTKTYPTCVRLLTGEGGTGKTRLALEMCKRLLNDGWAAGFLRSDFQTQSAQNFAKTLVQNQQPLLLIIDYAETRSTELLEFLAAVLSQKVASQIRILLLARSSGEWWGQLPTYDPRCEALLEGFATTGPYNLPALYEHVSERNRAFNQALTAFSKALNTPSPCIQPDLGATQYKSPLFLQMAALLALLGERTASAEALPQSLVRHEQRYWRKATANHTQQTMSSSSEPETNLLMTLVTLIGHASIVKEIESLWTTAGGQRSNLKPLFSSLSPLYPARQGLGGLQPDLLGEALVGRQILGSEGQALLDAVLGKDATATQRTHALTIFSRLLRYRTDVSAPLENALSRHFAHCAQWLFQVCIQTPSPLSLVAERSFNRLSPSVKLQMAGLLANKFKYEILPLSGLELLIRETLNTQAELRCKKSNASIDDWYNFSQTLLKLSLANSQLGKTAQALEFAKQSAEIHQRFKKNKPDRFEPALAISLNIYANRLSNVGDTTQALDVAKQALDIHQRLAKENHERFDSDLGMSLNNYANRLSDIGDAAQALDITKQALEIHQRLAKENHERFDSDLATSLNNYANRLSDIGDTTNALNAAKQALDIHQRLATNKPERFEAKLAMCLSNYATILSDAGKPTQALAYSKQSLDIHQKLAKDKPERFEPDWATSLNNYANHLSDVGEAAQALSVAKQALDINKRLAKDKPEHFESALALAFKNYASHLSDAGQTTNALTAVKQALDIYERLAEERPVKFVADVQESRLCIALWTWLSDDTTSLAPSSELSDTDIPYLMRPAHFYLLVLRALGRQESSDIATSIEAVWNGWNAMSTSQKTHCEALYLVICAYAQANACLGSRFSNWSEQLKTFKQRRNGELPRWMEQIAERKFFTIEGERT